jgi:hypothetical protein
MARSTFDGPVRTLRGFIATGNVMGQAIGAGTINGATDIDKYQGRAVTIGNTTTVFNLPEIVSDTNITPNTLSTIGLEYTFLITTNLSGETFTLNAGTAAGRSTADVFQGSAWYVDTGDNSVEGFNAAGTDTLTLDGSTRGGLAGSMVYCRAVGANIWLITADLNGSGTMVTPWS